MAQKNKSNFSPYKKKNQGKVQKRSRGHMKAEEIYSVSEANDRLYDIFKNHNFDHISHNERKLLAEYYSLLMHEQNKQNFTRIFKFRDIAIKQFIDCAIVNQLYPLQFPLMDIGSGPGLPGIVLKILNLDKQMYLAEGVQKRVEFLKQVRKGLNLSKLGIFGRNINEQFVYPIKGIVTRAVEDVSNTLNNVRHSLQSGGEVYFMKGPNVDEELEQALKKHSDYYKLKKDIAYDLPKTSHKRRLLVFEKIKAHPTVNLEDLLDMEYVNDD